MHFFKKRNTANPDGLLLQLKRKYNEHDFEMDPTLLEQIIMIEGRLAYFKKQYPEIAYCLEQFESTCANAFNTETNKFNSTLSLNPVTTEIRKSVCTSTKNYKDSYGLSIIYAGAFGISLFGGLDILLTGITVAAAGGPVGLIIGAAVVLTLAAGFLALTIASLIHIAMAKEKIKKYNDLSDVLTLMTDKPSHPDDIMENPLTDENMPPSNNTLVGTI